MDDNRIENDPVIAFTAFLAGLMLMGGIGVVVWAIAREFLA